MGNSNQSEYWQAGFICSIRYLDTTTTQRQWIWIAESRSTSCCGTNKSAVPPPRSFWSAYNSPSYGRADANCEYWLGLRCLPNYTIVVRVFVASHAPPNKRMQRSRESIILMDRRAARWCESLGARGRGEIESHENKSKLIHRSTPMSAIIISVTNDLDIHFEVFTPLGFSVRVTPSYWELIVTVKHPVMAGIGCSGNFAKPRWDSCESEWFGSLSVL